MKRRRIIAKVLDPGECRYYRAGQEFALGGFTPKGLCDSAYRLASSKPRICSLTSIRL